MCPEAALTKQSSKKVLALGLDGPNHELLTQWISSGALPVLKKLQSQGLAVNIISEKKYSNEHCWIPVLTGLNLSRWNHWLDNWDPTTYRFAEASLFDWLNAPVFYALGDACRVVSFDMAAPVVENVNGVQVSGFAAEFNECYPESRPAPLLGQLIERHGPDPKAHDAKRVINALSNREGVSWVVPNCYRAEEIDNFIDAVIQSVERRTAACLELMASEDWGLFLLAYTEIHSASHVIWHLSQPHPLQVLRQQGEDPLLAVYQAVDRSIGQLLDAAGTDVSVVFFTLDGTVADCLENARTIFLPEFLYRWNFPGKAALAVGDMTQAPPPLRLDYRSHWKHEVWKLRTPAGDTELESPTAQEQKGDAMNWCPANWYAPLWPQMAAFAMPSVADGYIRINVAGRESRGIVRPENFDGVCSDLIGQLSQLRDARTGQHVVREVIRVRDDPFDVDPKNPPADLIVVFHESRPLDVLDSPDYGRIGPVPYFRSSSHQSHGTSLHNLMLVCEAGTNEARVKPGHSKLEDIPATILDLLGLPVPPEFDGISTIPPRPHPAGQK